MKFISHRILKKSQTFQLFEFLSHFKKSHTSERSYLHVISIKVQFHNFQQTLIELVNQRRERLQYHMESLQWFKALDQNDQASFDKKITMIVWFKLGFVLSGNVT